MKALLVIDVQDSYMKRYEPDLLEQINKCIKNAYNNQYNIIYVKTQKGFEVEVLQKNLLMD